MGLSGTKNDTIRTTQKRCERQTCVTYNVKQELAAVKNTNGYHPCYLVHQKHCRTLSHVQPLASEVTSLAQASCTLPNLPDRGETFCVQGG